MVNKGGLMVYTHIGLIMVMKGKWIRVILFFGIPQHQMAGSGITGELFNLRILVILITLKYNGRSSAFSFCQIMMKVSVAAMMAWQMR